ncbi:hypothetical protein V8E54_001984 [Elaphomyces granulatus]
MSRRHAPRWRRQSNGGMEQSKRNLQSDHVCHRFFNDLRPLKEVVDAGKKKTEAEQNNLETWDSRARCFFHEVTHLTYFMNTPGKSPKVEDLTIKFKKRGLTHKDTAYGPYNAKVLRNYRRRGMGGFCTQRKADTYAFFALAKYVEKQIGRYPYGLPTKPRFNTTDRSPPRPLGRAHQSERSRQGDQPRYQHLHRHQSR